MENLEKTLNKIPILLLLALYCGYIGFDYYEWLSSANSELGQKKSSLVESKQGFEAAKKKLSTAQEFFKNLETLKLRIRQLAVQLDDTKTILTTELDVSKFIRMVTLEAKKLRLTIKGIKPANDVRKDYYVEAPFTVQVKGAYAQLMVFFDRISKLQQVIRVGDFVMKPSGNALTNYVELEGSVSLVAFKYLGTNADEIKEKLDDAEMSPTSTPQSKQKGDRS